MCKSRWVFPSSAGFVGDKIRRKQRTSSLNDEAGFAGSDRGIIKLRITVFTGRLTEVATALAVEAPLRLLGTTEFDPSTLLPAVDVFVVIADVSLPLPAAVNAAVCAAATSAAGGADTTAYASLVAAAADPAKAGSRSYRITNNNTKREYSGQE